MISPTVNKPGQPICRLPVDFCGTGPNFCYDLSTSLDNNHQSHVLRVSLAVIRTSVADRVLDYSTSSEAVRDTRGVTLMDMNEDGMLNILAQMTGAQAKRTPLFIQNNLICDTFFLKWFSFCPSAQVALVLCTNLGIDVGSNNMNVTNMPLTLLCDDKRSSFINGCANPTAPALLLLILVAILNQMILKEFIYNGRCIIAFDDFSCLGALSLSQIGKNYLFAPGMTCKSVLRISADDCLFKKVLSIQHPTSIFNIVLGNFTHDGKLDILVMSKDAQWDTLSMALYEGNHDRTFGASFSNLNWL
ncbi:hypothetical protein F5J12DRAFT_782007 [Pisolithus orientalis]|uniref:uncharacterized protein n=1 Tax=Pisolithus orientalis TaxID=936130 RepID=UPI002224F93F|nr:uncharacterized protein F5J12DRAFT_782007 [Pisolithus orientalis]KAI6009469.1 hypothetical protein F5J12DRAFT_782007 [Pisolithus orientalis]